MENRKYYNAYDDRYRQVHAHRLKWFHDMPSLIVDEIIWQHSISSQHKLLEIGCGEGRDAFSLLKQGFNLLATDVSPEAIAFCQKKMPDNKERFRILDCVTEKLGDKFDFIYAIAVLHMLALDEDRNAFYSFIREHLKPDGIALIGTMGDGIMEHQTDVRCAFDVQERIHEQSGKKLQIATTSCRIVSFQTFKNELRESGLHVIKQGITAVEPDFPQMMYAAVRL